MVIWPPSRGPVEFPLRFADRQVVDAGEAPLHVACGIELPVLVAVAAEPLAGVVVPFVGKAHRNPVSSEGPQFLDQPVIQFAGPLAYQEGMDLAAPARKLGAIAPQRIGGIDPDDAIGITRVPGIFCCPHFHERRVQRKRRQRRSGFHVHPEAAGTLDYPECSPMRCTGLISPPYTASTFPEDPHRWNCAWDSAVTHCSPGCERDRTRAPPY